VRQFAILAGQVFRQSYMEIAASKAAQGGDDLTAFERFPGIGVHASLVIKALRIGNPYRGRWSIF
jgi:hypothetical protein